MKTFFCILFCFFSIVFSDAQNVISGVVKDKKTGSTLPFATLITNNSLGTITDIDGKFSINSAQKIESLTISYVGYKSKNVLITNSSHLSIFLEPSQENLDEVSIPIKENIALKIIKKAIANKGKNYTQNALKSFKHKSYTKFLISADPDSISKNIDSVFVIKNGEKKFKKLDSTNYLFKNQIDKSHIYLSEKISEHKFERGKNKKETILASRMAGFKEPIYEFLALDVENFTFYEEVYSLLGNKFVNPLADNAPLKYSYKLLDTISRTKDSTFLVYYKPKKRHKDVGLEGVLYINSKDFALEKGIAQLKGVVTIKAVQDFEYKQASKIWFPNDTEISIRKGKSKKPIRLFDRVIFQGTNTKNDTIVQNSKKAPGDAVYVLSKSKNFDIIVNEPIKINNSASSIVIDEAASEKSEAYWNEFRTEPLTSRGLETYRVIDSIAEAQNVEKAIRVGRKILKGYFPSKYFDFNLSQIINYNNYEGLRLGFGGITNQKFSEKFKIDAYAAYGFKDDKFKYHFAPSLRLSKHNNTWFGVSYTDDLQEAAKTDFLNENTDFSLKNTRNLNISQFFNYKAYSVNLWHDLFPNVETILKLSNGKYKTLFNYEFINQNTTYTSYNLSTATLAIKWTPFSKYMEAPIGKIAIKNGYPIITTQYTRSFEDVLNGDFDFSKLSLKIEHRLKLLRNNSTFFLLKAGIVDGDAPMPVLYNNSGNYNFKTPWARRINFAGNDAFETMTYNEFISDKFISLQARHSFTRFKISKRIKPRLTLISRFAIGNIENQQKHKLVNFKPMNKGYLESGIAFNDIFYGLGVGSYYRYGAYANPKFSDNFALKVTYTFSLGL